MKKKKHEKHIHIYHNNIYLETIIFKQKPPKKQHETKNTIKFIKFILGWPSTAGHGACCYMYTH